MRRIVWLSALLALAVCAGLSGCGKEKAVSSEDVIEVAESIKDAAQKTEYLLAEANKYYNSEQFQEAINTAQYILQYVDKDSQAAKDLIEKAKSALAAAAGAAVEDVKKGIAEDLGK